ncbi:tRNA(5-methylaminomethyl-2-thiouridylate) methyltransferase [Desulfovibrio sp. OttesenSCG-928-A18]|nr:tRNA(5-methylaminomethyl-2-thiouridylate) methyltransferase [Desulfovibrio sp. OttesenSCG-928-A18]
MSEEKKAKAVALFSGGLDSILAARLVQEQGIEVLGLHFISPFFGKAGAAAYWERVFGIRIRVVDLGADYASMLARGPLYGYGSVMNPCVDCKILMIRRAREIMEELGACCIITGEVLGQRPMSQRRDALNIISRDAGARGLLLRPLCALRMDPTAAELAGFIDRERLLGISGRGRKDQMALAARFGIRERDMPTPGGGCRLTEKENARSYWPILLHQREPGAGDFALANTGRQYWHLPTHSGEGAYRLIIGRNQADNDNLLSTASRDDILFKTRDFPGPVALGRACSLAWPPEAVAAAAAFTASYSGRASAFTRERGVPVAVRVHRASLDAPGEEIEVQPERAPAYAWREYSWEETREALQKARTAPGGQRGAAPLGPPQGHDAP